MNQDDNRALRILNDEKMPASPLSLSFFICEVPGGYVSLKYRNKSTRCN